MFKRIQVPLASLAAVGLLLTACGGGGGGDGGTAAPAASTTVYSAGAITGLGSIIVNGQRIDDSSARIEDDEGQGRGRDDLRVGVQVEVQSRSSNGALVAQQVRMDSAVKGPVQSVNIAANTAVVLGQTVAVSTTTVFDARLTGGLAALQVGDIVEVHAAFDATAGVYRASRIEAEDSTSEYALRGVVSNLRSGAKSFDIGGAQINYASLSPEPTGLADGVRVKVRLATTPVGTTWQAVRLRLASANLPGQGEAHLRGLVSSFTSSTAFVIDGVTVDASGAAFPDGTSGLALGAAVSVEGSLRNGVLVATKVELESRHGDDDSRRPELHGAITALDTAAQTFVLRGVTVSYATVQTWRDGSAQNLAVGRALEVKGTWGAGGTIVQASRIQFE